MAMETRYYFAKRTYKKHLVLLKDKKRYVTFKADKEILKYLNFVDLKTLNKNKINYIIVDNNNNINIKTFKNNNYDIIYSRYMISELLKKLLCL